MNSIRDWMEVPFTKAHWKMVKNAIISRPYDYGYLLGLERDKLSEMLAYFAHSQYLQQEKLSYVMKYISLAIKLLDIMNEDTKIWTMEGDLEFEFLKKEDKDTSYWEVHGDPVYRCLVNVNLRNISRFVPDEEKRSVYLEQPHLLYMLKAQHLYYQIRMTRTEWWWD